MALDNVTRLKGARVVKGRHLRDAARAALACGRFGEALDTLRRARRYPIDDDPAQLALEETQALFGLSRYSEVLTIGTRALSRRPPDKDRRARLRIVRALALWEIGRVALARNELRRIPAAEVEPLTRARLEEAQARIAWGDQDISHTREHLERARALYEAHACPQGVARTLEVEGAVLRDAGLLEEALAKHARRLEVVSGTGRADEVARARADRGSLLILTGRWKDARAELDEAATLFHQIGDARETTVAGVTRALADFATGDLAAARRALEKAC